MDVACKRTEGDFPAVQPHTSRPRHCVLGGLPGFLCRDLKKKKKNPSKSIGVKKRLPHRSQLRAPEVYVFTERTSSLVRGQTHTHILVSRSEEMEITFDPI